MLIILIAVGIVIAVLILGALLAGGFAQLDKSIAESKVALEEKEQGYNPALTLGYEIKTNADPEEQVKEARREAAKKAAALPRGANMGIGRLGESNLRTAFAGVKEDPFTAAKIAIIHGWDGVRSGPTAAAAAPAAATTQAAPAAGGKVKLVPGKDYPVIEITDDMPPAEKRKARIANAKAKSAAIKAMKAAGTVPQQQAAPAAAAPAAAARQPAAAPAAAAGIPEPDYIEITDDMPPEEVRKARIHNAKARSKYNKALKAAGVSPGEVESETAASTTSQPAEQPAAAAPAPDLAGIPEPDYIEITDDMPPDEMRKARIHNAKARSKYNKALKAAGIDPKSVS